MVGGALAITLPPLIVVTVHAVPASAPIAGLEDRVSVGEQATAATAATATASGPKSPETPGGRRPVTAIQNGLRTMSSRISPRPPNPTPASAELGLRARIASSSG